jgi:hypothetical protein
MKTVIRIVGLLGVTAIGAMAWTRSALGQQADRFLGTPANNLKVLSYGTADKAGNPLPAHYDNNVVVGGEIVGHIDFDYDTFLGKNSAANGGGVALSGGFYPSNAFKVMPGYALEWAQIATATVTGADATKNFNLPQKNAGWYPDAFPTDALAQKTAPFAPAYPSLTTYLDPPNGVPAPDLGFRDSPYRVFPDGKQTWQAELGLVAISRRPNDAGVKTVDVIDTFGWGFDVIVAPKNQIASISPQLFGISSKNYLATENAYYSGTSPKVGSKGEVLTDKYNFVDDANVFVATGVSTPEPSTLVMTGTAMVVLSAVSWLRRRTRVASTFDQLTVLGHSRSDTGNRSNSTGITSSTTRWGETSASSARPSSSCPSAEALTEVEDPIPRGSPCLDRGSATGSAE